MKIKYKLGISTFMWVFYFKFLDIFKPILQNEITANKLSNTDGSFTEQIYFDSAFEWGFWALIVLTILMYLSNVKKIIGGNK